MQREKIEEVYRKEKDFLTGQLEKAISSFSSISNFKFQFKFNILPLPPPPSILFSPTLLRTC